MKPEFLTVNPGVKCQAVFNKELPYSGGGIVLPLPIHAHVVIAINYILKSKDQSAYMKPSTASMDPSIEIAELSTTETEPSSIGTDTSTAGTEPSATGLERYIAATNLSMTRPDDSLHELLMKEHSKLKNYKDEPFICIEAVKRILTPDRLLRWATDHPLWQKEEDRPDVHQIVHWICNTACLFFTVLILAGLESLAWKFCFCGLRDSMLFDEPSFDRLCELAKVDKSQRKKLIKYRSYVGLLLAGPHQEVPKDTVLPYVRREDLDKYGSYGVVYRVTVMAGHLTTSDKTVVAEKRIRAKNDRSRGEWRKLFREVENLQQRRHPNIIRLLASYYLDSVESGEALRTLHLVFPWAEMDLAQWMTGPSVPANLVDFPSDKRRQYIYRSTYRLVSALSFLHREFKGVIAAHYDLKPKNILVVGGEFKIADLGRSRLRPMLEGSATEGVSELGTYEYQPPEYWNSDGTRSEEKHGRAFDVWAMGCIIIELGTLIVHDWSGKVSKFKERRRANMIQGHQSPESVQDGADASFHNNLVAVTNWVEQLKYYNSDQKLDGLLDVALHMMARYPKDRMYMWEAEMDLHELLSPDDDQIPVLEKASLCEKPPKSKFPSVHYQNANNSRSEIPYNSQTPLHRAARKEDRVRIIRLWELGWSLTVHDEDKEKPWDILQRSNDGFLCKLEENIKELTEAAKNGDVITVKNHLGQGISPLMVATDTSRLALFFAAESANVAVVNCLLQTKPKEQITWENNVQKTVLHAAAAGGSAEIIKQVLRYSPDINHLAGSNFNTPLYQAARHGHKEAAKILLEHGAQVYPSHSLSVQSRETPIWAAVFYHGDAELLNLLLEAEDSHKCLEQKTVWGDIPILHAAKCGNTKCFEALQRKGASLHVVGANGDTVLHAIVFSGRLDFLKQQITNFTSRDWETRNRDRLTPLDLADHLGHKEMFRFLKQHLRNLPATGHSTSGEHSSHGIRRVQQAFQKLFQSG